MTRYAPGAPLPKLMLSVGKPCPYCDRTMGDDDVGLQPTRDHHPIPRSRGGTRIIICCFDCNNVKGDMSEAEWVGYRAMNPEWWKKRAVMGRKPRSRFRRIVQPETRTSKLAEELALFRKLREGFHEKFGGEE